MSSHQIQGAVLPLQIQSSVSPPQLVLGIDPGLSGAFVVYDATANSVINARMVPTLVLKRNSKERRFVNIPSLVSSVREISNTYKSLVAWLELVGANPMHGRRQGTSSMFSFGNSNGCIETSIVAAGIPYDKVSPAVWKKALGCTQDKDQALQRASELIPNGTPYWTPKRGEHTKEDCKGIAEAALIAYYGAHFGAAKKKLAA